MTTKTKAFETKDALDLYKKIIYTEKRGGITIVKTRYKFLKQRRSKNK